MMFSMKSVIVIPMGMYLRLIDSRTLSSSIYISSRRCSFARSASMIFHFTFGSAVVISLLSISLRFPYSDILHISIFTCHFVYFKTIALFIPVACNLNPKCCTDRESVMPINNSFYTAIGSMCRWELLLIETHVIMQVHVIVDKYHIALVSEWCKVNNCKRL